MTDERVGDAPSEEVMRLSEALDEVFVHQLAFSFAGSRKLPTASMSVRQPDSRRLAMVERAGGGIRGLCVMFLDHLLVLGRGADRAEDSELVHVIGYPYAIGDNREGREPINERLLRQALAYTQRHTPSLPVVCLLPSKSGFGNKLTPLGFRRNPTAEICIDPVLIANSGYQGLSSELNIWRRDPDPADQSQTLRGAIDAVVDEANASAQISSATLRSIEASPEFWSRRRSFCVHSAFPILNDVFARHRSGLNPSSPRRALIAPSAGGDFVSVLAGACGSIEAIAACDIQRPMLDVASFRAERPWIDSACRSLLDELDAYMSGASAECPHFQRLLQRVPGLGSRDVEQLISMIAHIADQLVQSVATPDWLFPIRSAVRLVLQSEPLECPIDVFKGLERLLRDDPIAVAASAPPAGPSPKFEPICCDLRASCDQLLAADPFDLIVSWEATHMFADDELADYLHLLVNALAPDGTLIVTALRTSSIEMPEELDRVRSMLPQGAFDVQHREYSRSATQPGLYARLAGHFHAIQIRTRDANVAHASEGIGDPRL